MLHVVRHTTYTDIRRTKFTTHLATTDTPVRTSYLLLSRTYVCMSHTEYVVSYERPFLLMKRLLSGYWDTPRNVGICRELLLELCRTYVALYILRSVPGTLRNEKRRHHKFIFRVARMAQTRSGKTPQESGKGGPARGKPANRKKNIEKAKKKPRKPCEPFSTHLTSN